MDMNERHRIQRVRHEIHRRTAQVVEVEALTPRMRRIALASPELDGFYSPSPDDHVKIFVPTEKGELAMRDFTPRHFSASTRTLTIDFALHDAGPATKWAASASVGDVLGFGGPKGSRLTPDDFDWYLLIGDETALPAIGRRAEELRAGVPVLTVVTVFDQQEEQQFETRAAMHPTWVHRGPSNLEDPERLREVVANLELPAGEGFVWIAGEAAIARSLRALFVERGHPRAWIHAAGYWQRGSSSTHVVIGDE